MGAPGGCILRAAPRAFHSGACSAGYVAQHPHTPSWFLPPQAAEKKARGAARSQNPVNPVNPVILSNNWVKSRSAYASCAVFPRHHLWPTDYEAGTSGPEAGGGEASTGGDLS